MGGMLVDDDHAVARLRHDIGLVQLGARCAERPVDRRGRSFDRLSAHVRRRRADIERRLRGFRETRCEIVQRRRVFGCEGRGRSG